MTCMTFLCDHQAESLTGGRSWGSGSYKFDLSSISYSKTAVGQSNEVTNTGLGLLVGFGSASSFQANAADVFSLIG